MELQWEQEHNRDGGNVYSPHLTNNRKKEQMNYQTARERERERERETGGWRLLVVSLSLRSDPMRVLLLTLLVCLASSCLGDDTVRWSSTSSL